MPCTRREWCMVVSNPTIFISLRKNTINLVLSIILFQSPSATHSQVILTLQRASQLSPRITSEEDLHQRVVSFQFNLGIYDTANIKSLCKGSSDLVFVENGSRTLFGDNISFAVELKNERLKDRHFAQAVPRRRHHLWLKATQPTAQRKDTPHEFQKFSQPFESIVHLLQNPDELGCVDHSFIRCNHTFPYCFAQGVRSAVYTGADRPIPHKKVSHSTLTKDQGNSFILTLHSESPLSSSFFFVFIPSWKSIRFKATRLLLYSISVFVFIHL